ncbi:MAG: hypothetical protein U9N33_08200 [Campylobacterota bacterium]|nr:hypothetical protein [Campylobacterota bacterium]
MTREEAEAEAVGYELECDQCGTVCDINDTECRRCGGHVDFLYHIRQIEELIYNNDV